MSPEPPVGSNDAGRGGGCRAIFAAIHRHNTPLSGPRRHATEVRDELSEPVFDPTSGARLVGDAAGADVAPPWACTGTSACGRCWPSASGRPGPDDLTRRRASSGSTRPSGSTLRLHDLRHTHGSLLIKEGVPVKVVSERLGHANVAFTIETYQHALPGMQRDAARTYRATRRTSSTGFEQHGETPDEQPGEHQTEIR